MYLIPTGPRFSTSPIYTRVSIVSTKSKIILVYELLYTCTTYNIHDSTKNIPIPEVNNKRDAHKIYFDRYFILLNRELSRKK